MTELGKFLDKKSVNKAEILRKIGINTARLTTEELYLNGLTMGIKPSLVLGKICKNIKFIKR